MRITFILPEMNLSGGVRVVAIYAERLSRRGHDVRVFSTQPKNVTLRHRLRALVRGDLQRRTDRGVPSQLRGPQILYKVVKHRPIVDADLPDADVVIATWWETAQWVANLSPSKGKKAYFMQDYGAPGQELSQIVPTWRLPLYKITISRWLVELIRQYFGDAQVSLVPNAVDHESFYGPPRGRQLTPTVGFVYRPGRTKGADLAFEAVDVARHTIPPLRLVGYGTRRPLGRISGQLEFHLCPPDVELREIYSQCDAWLFPSRREGFGLPILEAMACRTPVIATRAGSAPELLEEGGGILIPDATVEDMAAAIVRVFDISEFDWKNMSDAAYKTASSYSWEDATDRFEEALDHAKRQARVAPRTKYS